MSAGRPPVPSILKLIRGHDVEHPKRLRDDRPNLAEPPELPPGATLSPLEQKIWDWLLKKRYVQGLHESTDGVAFLRCVRLFARAQEVDAKIAASDVVARNPRTQKLELTAHARLSRDLWTQIGVAMEEIGGTPIGRARMAGAMKDKAQGDLWADFD